MGVLVLIMGIAILVVLAAMFLYLNRVEKIIMDIGLKCVGLSESHEKDLVKLSMAVQNQFHTLEKRANPPSKVSDPFKGQKEIYQSKKHIVVPKTPDEIRAQNFAEIQKGAEYGSVD